MCRFRLSAFFYLAGKLPAVEEGGGGEVRTRTRTETKVRYSV